MYFYFQDPNPALRLKDDIIAESGLGVGPLETNNGQVKRRESPDFDDNNDLSVIEDENMVGGGLRRDIDIENIKNIVDTTKSSSNEVDWKVIFGFSFKLWFSRFISGLIRVFNYKIFIYSILMSVRMLLETHLKRMKMYMVEINLIKRLVTL